MRRLLITLWLALAFSAWVGSLHASPSYPARLAQAAQMPNGCTPSCVLCHDSNSGGLGTANQPFAQTMVLQGQLTGSDASLLAPALERLRTQGSDSDSDGRLDTAELAAGTDPNDPAPGASLCATGPSYGCGARLVSRPARLAWQWFLVIGLGLLGARRRLTVQPFMRPRGKPLG